MDDTMRQVVRAAALVRDAQVTYFTNQAGRMAYDQYRARGLDIGSGMVESACKYVIGARGERVNARRTVPWSWFRHVRWLVAALWIRWRELGIVYGNVIMLYKQRQCQFRVVGDVRFRHPARETTSRGRGRSPVPRARGTDWSPGGGRATQALGGYR